MTPRCLPLLIALFSVSILAGPRALAQESATPEVVHATASGENLFPLTGLALEFDVFWTGLNVGKIVAAIKGETTHKEQPVYAIEAFAKTTGTVEKLYKAQERFLGFLNPDNGETVFYEEWKFEEDKWQLDRLLIFDHPTAVVKRHTKKGFRNEVHVKEDTLCPAGAVHYLMTRPLEIGDKYSVTITEGKHLYRAEAEVMEGEEVETIFGTVDTLKIVPKVFWKGEPMSEQDMYVLMTKDERRIPVKVFVDIEVGSFTGVLTGYRPPKEKVAEAQP
jgi:hypothetical protein